MPRVILFFALQGKGYCDHILLVWSYRLGTVYMKQCKSWKGLIQLHVPLTEVIIRVMLVCIAQGLVISYGQRMLVWKC